MPADAFEIAERGAEQKVGAGAAIDQVARDVRPIAHEVLRRRRFVIDVARVPAEILGVPWEKVEVVWGDTSKHVPWTCTSATCAASSRRRRRRMP